MALPSLDPSAVDPTTPTSFDSHDPATGAVVATFPVAGPDEVAAAVERAREGARYWGALSYGERAERLKAWAALLQQRTDELAELVHRENGKPVADAKLEIVVTLDHLAWAAANARKVLAPRRINPGLLMVNHSAELSYEPFGVIGVIGPWNYPVFTPAGSIAYALAAGNAVVFKPSEFTPAVGTWLADSFAVVVPEAPVFTVITGFGATGAALCRAGVDKIAFTGSAATGSKVMHECADSLVPVLIEAGGKDALIVDEDADVERAAEAAAWGGLSNAGQTCAGIERVYAHTAIYDAFLAALREQVQGLTAGPQAPIGPITMPGQVGIIRRHVDEALAHGARAVIGGADAVGDRFVQPTVLVDVPETCSAITEETFGPTITVTRVADMDEAVRLANGTDYGLGASVFGRERAESVARRLRVGMVAVNSVMSFIAVPALPFGGVGKSGFGRIHGADGLREFSRPKSMTKRLFYTPVEVMTFRRTRPVEKAVDALMAARFTLPEKARRIARRD